MSNSNSKKNLIDLVGVVRPLSVLSSQEIDKKRKKLIFKAENGAVFCDRIVALANIAERSAEIVWDRVFPDVEERRSSDHAASFWYSQAKDEHQVAEEIQKSRNCDDSCDHARTPAGLFPTHWYELAGREIASVTTSEVKASDVLPDEWYRQADNLVQASVAAPDAVRPSDFAPSYFYARAIKAYSIALGASGKRPSDNKPSFWYAPYVATKPVAVAPQSVSQVEAVVSSSRQPSYWYENAVVEYRTRPSDYEPQHWYSLASERETLTRGFMTLAEDHAHMSNWEKHRLKGISYDQSLVDNDIILSVRHLKKFFTLGSGIKRDKLKAVHDVSFDVKRGEVFGLVGESGCGKTTTGRTIMGLHSATSGSVYFKGYRVGAGNRWNLKEIKWKRKRGKERIAKLRSDMKLEIKEMDPAFVAKERKQAIEAAKKEFERETADRTAALNRIKASNLGDSTAADEARIHNELASIKKNLDDRLASIEADTATKLKRIKPDTKSQVAEIKATYKASIADTERHIKATLKEQRQKLRQINYDTHHVDKHLLTKMQMIFQDPIDSLDPRMTVQDIIQEGLKIQNFAKHETERLEAESHEAITALLASDLPQSVKDLKKGYIEDYYKAKIARAQDYKGMVSDTLRKVGLIPDYANRYPHEFSGGQRQRIGIARALIMKPELIIADEPISALDVSIRAQIINLLNDLRDEMGLTILFIAHDLSVVKYFCERIAVMYYGNMVELATSDELFRHPLHPYTKSLLSAIPKPDPLSEKSRVRIKYNPATDHDYSWQEPRFQEIVPGHFVLANDAEMEKYRQEIVADDVRANQSHK